ncbi:MerC family mercury resistance protein [Klebsiella pneumoniae]|uniref:MerC family mercury resistance protein n=1 Tax=Klebsiella pneumoniae TaxID=573 RepID=UPI003B587E2F
MGLMTRIADKTGALGSVVSAMGCGLLSSPRQLRRGHRAGLLEPVRGTVHQPPAAAVCRAGLPGERAGWFSHRQWLRSLLGMIGPAIVFAATVWLLGNCGRRT